MGGVDKVDLKRTDPYRARAGEFRVLDVPPTRYLAVDGHGDPNTASAYADALATLYPVAYAMKFAGKRAGRDYVVPPLEALWWADDLDVFTTARDKSRWSWTALLAVPEWLPDQAYDAAVASVRATKRLPALDRLRLERLEEGRCVQTLHLGPYDDEGPVLHRLHHEVLPDRGLRPTGHHHEIYLGDPRRTAPSRLRTILRQPVAPTEPSGT